jgi:hypothetical protein
MIMTVAPMSGSPLLELTLPLIWMFWDCPHRVVIVRTMKHTKAGRFLNIFLGRILVEIIKKNLPKIISTYPVEGFNIHQKG